MRKLLIRVLAATVVLPAFALAGAVPAAEAATTTTTLGLVKDTPAAASATPQVLDGKVLTIARVGDTMLLGGQFTTARNASDTTSVARTNLLAFDVNTGRISTTFAPSPDGAVNTIIPSGDGSTAYIGGAFNNIGTTAIRRVARINVNDGSVVSTFNAGSVAGEVKDLRLYRGRLFVAGAFTHIAGQAQLGLATVNPTTGKFDPYVRTLLAGTQNGGYTGLIKIDISAANQRLLAIGNFSTVDGADRRQVMMLDLGATSATLANWQTNFYKSTCSSSFNSYMRDLDISDDGSFGVISTTGAYRASSVADPLPACDTTARFEMGATGSGIAPSWIDYTGGDTTYAVEITDAAVYTGGHARWQNNPFAGDRAGAGSVPRPGIAALDPVNGLPLDWNPTRDRGVGVFDFRFDDRGLWVASDTEHIGPFAYRPRIALMPVGGTTFPSPVAAVLPNDVYSRTAGQGLVRSYSSDGSSFGPVRDAVDPSHAALTGLKGAFMINGDLYSAWSDKAFIRQSYDGAHLGAEEAVNTQDQLVALTDWQSDLSTATSMTYQRGRIYFTLPNQTSLFYRYFTPESKVVGARRLVASGSVTGLSFSTVRGMFLSGDSLYTSDATGTLRRTTWSDPGTTSGAPVAGTTTVVSGPTVDAHSWTGPLFLFQDAHGDPAGGVPQARQTSTCTSLTCDFSSDGSVAGTGSIDQYGWSFGDGTSSSQADPSHTYGANGTYTVTLTITNSAGDTSTTSDTVKVTRVNQPPTARFTQTCAQLACSFDGSTSSDPDGNVSSYSWDFGDSSPAQSGATPDHTYAAAGSYQVTLTVTDGDGLTGSVTRQVDVSTAAISQVADANTNGNRSSHSVKVPSSVRAGDLMVLAFTANSTAATVTPPAGWTQLRSVAQRDTLGTVWTRTATADDPGSTVTIGTSAILKSDLALSAYRSSTGTAQVVDSAMAFDATSSTDHTSPTVTAQGDKAWLVTYFGRESSTVSSWSSVAGQTTRTSSTGAGGGNVSATLVDSAGPVAAGTRGGLTGTLSSASGNVVSWSLLIAPA